MLPRTLIMLVLSGAALSLVAGCMTVDPYLAQGDLKGAESFCYTEYGEDRRTCMQKLAAAYEAQGQLADALDAYRAASDEGNVQRLSTLLGEGKLNAGDFREARKLLAEAGMSPNEVNVRIAEAALAKSDLRQAYEAFTSSGVSVKDYCPRIAGQIGKNLSDMDQWVGSFYECHKQIAKELLKANRLDDAVRLYGGLGSGYGNYSKPSDEDAAFYRTLAEAYLKQEKCGEALEYYQKAGAPVADFVQPVAICFVIVGNMSNAGYLIDQAGLVKKEVMVQAALALESQHKFINAGLHYLDAGHQARAAAAFTRALDDPSEDIRKRALINLWKTGREQTAKVLEKAAADSAPTVASTASLLEKLVGRKAVSVAVVDMGTAVFSPEAIPGLADILRAGEEFRANLLMDMLDTAVGKDRLAPFRHYLANGRMKVKKRDTRPLTRESYYGETDLTLERVNDLKKSGEFDVIIAYYTASGGERGVKRHYVIMVPCLNEIKWFAFGWKAIIKKHINDSLTPAESRQATKEAINSYKFFEEDLGKYLKVLFR